MKACVPYFKMGGTHRPYLFIVIRKGDKVSPLQIALLDSGADHTVIPYSLGVSIGIGPLTEEEELKVVGGVGGSVTFIERECIITMANYDTEEAYDFVEKVWWLHPDEQALEEQKALEDRIKYLDLMKKQSLPGTELEKHFVDEIESVGMQLAASQVVYEQDVLLGRPFMANFKDVNLKHVDDSPKSCVEYEIHPNKPVKVLKFEPSAAAKKQMTMAKEEAGE